MGTVYFHSHVLMGHHRTTAAATVFFVNGCQKVMWLVELLLWGIKQYFITFGQEKFTACSVDISAFFYVGKSCS